MRFTNIKLPDGSLASSHTCSFTLAPINVAYANTLRRLIMTGVEMVAFRADMTDKGTTTDVKVLKNDTPMTNEMLAHRIGLLPIYIPKPLSWNPDKYTFRLKATANKDSVRDVTCADFEIRKIRVLGEGIDLATEALAAKSMVGKAKEVKEAKEEESEEGEEGEGAAKSASSSKGGEEGEGAGASASSSPAEAVVEKDLIDPATFFPPHPITRDTCLIATLTPGGGSIDIVAKATLGTGREHARFQPTSRCTYTYTRDMDLGRLNEHLTRWAQEAKKVTITKEMSKDAEPLKSLLAEFNTMEINRVYLVDEKGEPFSFDFVVRSTGPLSVAYIVQRACEVGEAMVARYANIDTADLASLPEVTVSPADSRLLGTDFLFKGHDHTLGNMLQTWLVENHLNAMEGSGKTPITYAGYVIPHPLRDEMLLRIGVADGKAATACKALAEACAGCADMFRQLKTSWITGTSTATGKSRMELLRETSTDIRGTMKLPAAAAAAATGAGAGLKPLRGAPAAVAKRATTTGAPAARTVAPAAAAGAGAAAPAAKSTAGVEAAMKALQAQVAALGSTKPT